MAQPTTTTTAAAAPRAMAWDPKSPSTLFLPSRDSGTGNLRVDAFLADDGIGCNPYERSALITLTTAHGDHLEGDDVKALSRSYQRSLRECLAGWEEDESIGEEENLELLKVVYAATQLSDVYLLMPPSIDDEDPWFTPGAVTADTVRYLRLHHMSDPYAAVGDGLEDMLESSQPEQFGAIYWDLLRTLVLRGCLDDAWALISRHFICRRCFEEGVEVLDSYHAATIEKDREGFLILRSLLLSAPLPGGRSDWNDARDLDNNDDESREEDNELLLDGVARDAYKLWDTDNVSSVDDGPLTYDPHAAISVHNTWRRAVVDNASLHGLVRRIPQLQPNVLAILSGNFETVVFDSWSSALCAELLYQRPNLCPRDMHVRAASAMKRLGVSVDAGFDDVILSVMEGDAGRVVEVLYHFGGGSGAALPATMTALLCSLLREAHQIPQPEPSSFNVQTELLLSASQAILSSLSSSEPDLGVRLSTKLLLPYVKPNGDFRITATLGETLTHYGPSSDSEGRVLLGLCRDLVGRKCRKVLDGCISMVLYRHEHYLWDQRPGGAVHWLLVGIELEVLTFATTDGRRHENAWQTALASGVCGALLCSTCDTVSQSLLRGLASDEEQQTNVARDFNRAKEMMAAIQDDDPSGLAHQIREVKLMEEVLGIGLAIVQNKDNAIIAQHIVACLQLEVDDHDDDIVVSEAHWSMYWDLLSLAHKILKQDKDFQQIGTKEERFKSSFDASGILTLFEKLTDLTLSGYSTNDEVVAAMRLALGEGRMRAIAAANATRQRQTQSQSKLGSACSAKLSAYSRSDQQRVVEMMMDPGAWE